MQNMFATMQVTPQTQPKQESSLDLLNSSSSAQQQPVAANNFNTMQMMFSTNAQGIPQTTPSNVDLTIPTGPNQFNTMQNLFATGMPQSNLNGLIQPVNPSIPVSTGASSTSDFYSINGLFATGVPGQVGQQGITLNQPPMNLGTINTGNTGNNFNTMQNLFATSSQVPSNVSLSQPSSQITDIKDFSTLQNLFKTGSGVVLPPPVQTNTQLTKQDDPFALLGMPQMTETTQKV